MRLQSLTLRNFKGLHEFKLAPDGRNINVFGDNAAGKTTLADGFMWLLFDKDSANRKDFEIKTLGPNGEPIHGLEHEVEAILDLEPGQIALGKVYKEQWTKRRGSAAKQFTGHATDHFIDGVPVTKAEYTARVAAIADESAFRLLTDPTYFNEQMHWQKRREILLQVCGDVSDTDVITSDASLAGLPEILGKRTLEQLRKVLAARRAEINQELDRIPVRIDEVRRGLPEAGGDAEALKGRIAALRGQRQQAEAERVRIQSGGESAELNKRLREIEATALDAQNRRRAQADAAAQDVRQRAVALAREADARTIEAHRLLAEITEDERQVGRLQTRIEELRQQWYQVDAREMTLSIEEVCPACGQALPAERVREARERAIADHNARKARELEEVSAEGRRLAAQAAVLEQRLSSSRQAADVAEKASADLQRQADEAQQKAVRLQVAVPPLDLDPEYMKLQAARQRIESELANLREGNAEALARTAERARELDGQIATVEADLGRIEQRERGLRRIEELAGDERRLAAEFEELERQLYLTEQFIRTKVRLLEDRINGRFRMARFKLFDQQVNGGITEVCDTTYNGVPYSDLNHGARLNIGLDIINTLAEHYRFVAPVWIDNAEAVTAILPTRGQQVRLIVSAADKTLRVEREPAKIMEVA